MKTHTLRHTALSMAVAVLLASVQTFAWNGSARAQVGLQPRPQGPAPQAYRPGEDATAGPTASPGDTSCDWNPFEVLTRVGLEFVGIAAQPALAVIGALVWVPTGDTDILESSMSVPFTREPFKSCSPRGPSSAD